jgi:queuine/archaeosine tRNA-ribosyltransferase
MRRGTILTPAFMPVGTAATVKAMKPGTCAWRARTSSSATPII